MTLEQSLPVISAVITTANVVMTYFNFQHGRKKDFQDKLFQLKLDACKELNDACYEATVRLDINSSPFVQIYDTPTKQEWLTYCQENMGEEIIKGFDMQRLAYKNAFILPAEIVDNYLAFTYQCIAYVKNSYHFDQELIVENQDQLWELYLKLVNSFRKDLDINTIDWGLRKRITS